MSETSTLWTLMAWGKNACDEDPLNRMNSEIRLVDWQTSIQNQSLALLRDMAQAFAGHYRMERVYGLENEPQLVIHSEFDSEVTLSIGGYLTDDEEVELTFHCWLSSQGRTVDLGSVMGSLDFMIPGRLAFGGEAAVFEERAVTIIKAWFTLLDLQQEERI